MRNSSRRRGRSAKPAKPYPDFPLFPHATGRWAKKVRGRLHYFGKVDVDLPDFGADAALRRWQDQKDDLLAGWKPRTNGAGLTVKSLVNRFLTSKKLLFDGGELSPHSWQAYYRVCRRIVEAFGLTRLVAHRRSQREFRSCRSGQTANSQAMLLSAVARR